MSGPAAPSPLRPGFLLAYGTGLALCVAWPLVLQVLLGTVLHPGFLGPTPLAGELGYTFTGLVVLGALFVKRRSVQALRTFATLAPGLRPRAMVREILLYAALFELSAFFGLVYDGMGGPQAERYARSFIALAAIMFLVFVPRLSAWERASRP